MPQRLILFLIAAFLLLPAWAERNAQGKEKQDKVVFFARILPERPEIYAGDSCVVSLVLYSNLAFADIQQKPENLTIKGGRARLLPRYSPPTPFHVQMEGGVFNAVVWQQYVVGRDEVGKIRFSSPTFNATFVVVEPSDDPFERFFGFAPRQQRLVKGQCKLDAFTLPVVERPKRSSQDILQSGGSLI